MALCMTSMMVNDRKDLPVTDGQPVGEGHDSCLGIKDHLEIVFSNGVKQVNNIFVGLLILKNN